MSVIKDTKCRLHCTYTLSPRRSKMRNALNGKNVCDKNVASRSCPAASFGQPTTSTNHKMGIFAKWFDLYILSTHRHRHVRNITLCPLGMKVRIGFYLTKELLVTHWVREVGRLSLRCCWMLGIPSQPQQCKSPKKGQDTRGWPRLGD